MTTLQQSAMRKALEALETCSYGDYSAKHVVDPSFDGDAVEAAIESLNAALAQQGAQQPVAWYEYNQDLDAWFLAYGHNPKAKTRPLVFGDTAAPAQKPVAYITQTEQGPMVWTPEMYDEACTYCDDGEFPVPLYTAAPAPQAQPMTDPCKTCSHFKEGNLPGVRIHDETCYGCSEYYANKWEAKSE